MKRKMAHWVAALLAIMAEVQVVTAPEASASCSYDANNFAPDMGLVIAVGPYGGGNYTAAFHFQLTDAQVVSTLAA